MGTPEFAVPSLAAVLHASYDVVGVLTKEDQPVGRGQKLVASAVKQLAQAHVTDDPTAVARCAPPKHRPCWPTSHPM